jgi:hypothetical protein
LLAGVKFGVTLKDLDFTKKLEILTIGLALPISLFLYTLYRLISLETIFPGRGAGIVTFHGSEAILISMFWFSFALFFFAKSFLFNLNIISQRAFKFCVYSSGILWIVGLVSVLSSLK